MKLEKNIIIHQPVEQVYLFITDANNIPKWMDAKNTTGQTHGPAQVGSRYTHKIELMGQKLDLATEVTEMETNRALSLKMQAGPMPITSRFTLTSVPGGTQVSVAGVAEQRGILKFIPNFQSLVEKFAEEQLQKLKHSIEAEN